METFKIHDSQLNASSVHASNNIYGPQNARLNFHHSNNPQRFPCWIAERADTKPWIEVDLLWLSTVSGVLTQGRYDFDQWVTSFSVSSKVDGKNFQFYMKNNEKKVGWKKLCGNIRGKFLISPTTLDLVLSTLDQNPNMVPCLRA